ncbi:MAG TPA: NTP transferase domain-containing protein, partial [Stellaceae bacterium]|nr:NTP transferase domain-containing protein [Stellaceae bacterium]
MSSPSLAAIILAAGKGTRMRSLLPKVLHPIAQRPMIGHVLAALGPLAPERIVVVVGPGMEEVAAAVCPAETAVQSEALGTAHAVLAARHALAGFAGDVLV